MGEYAGRPDGVEDAPAPLLDVAAADAPNSRSTYRTGGLSLRRLDIAARPARRATSRRAPPPPLRLIKSTTLSSEPIQFSADAHLTGVGCPLTATALGLPELPRLEQSLGLSATPCIAGQSTSQMHKEPDEKKNKQV
jgi:hypothetical protein